MITRLLGGLFSLWWLSLELLGGGCRRLVVVIVVLHGCWGNYAALLLRFRLLWTAGGRGGIYRFCNRLLTCLLGQSGRLGLGFAQLQSHLLSLDRGAGGRGQGPWINMFALTFLTFRWLFREIVAGGGRLFLLGNRSGRRRRIFLKLLFTGRCLGRLDLQLLHLLAPHTQVLVVALLVGVVECALGDLFVALDRAKLHLARGVVPTAICGVPAVGAVAAEPQLSVQEGVLLLAIHLLAVVAVEAFIV